MATNPTPSGKRAKNCKVHATPMRRVRRARMTVFGTPPILNRKVPSFTWVCDDCLRESSEQS